MKYHKGELLGARKVCNQELMGAGYQGKFPQESDD